MAVAVPAMATSCPPSLHGPSRLSRASSAGAKPPLLAEDGAQTTLFTNEEFKALMHVHRELFSEESLLRQGQLHAPPFSLDTVLDAEISEDDVALLAPLFCEEEILVLSQCTAQQASPRPAGSRLHDQAGEKRKQPPWPSCISDDDDDMEEAEPPPPPPPPVKRARTRSRSRRQLREWHNEIATRFLLRQHHAPELSRGRTLLGCQCLELALADDHGPRGGGGGGYCALHQDARPGRDREWMYSAQGRVPLVGGPGEVLVPTLAAGNSNAMVQRYARWRRSVWMPTRFYVERAVQQARAAAADPQPEDDWMMA